MFSNLYIDTRANKQLTKTPQKNTTDRSENTCSYCKLVQITTYKKIIYLRPHK